MTNILLRNVESTEGFVEDKGLYRHLSFIIWPGHCLTVHIPSIWVLLPRPTGNKSRLSWKWLTLRSSISLQCCCNCLHYRWLSGMSLITSALSPAQRQCWTSLDEWVHSSRTPNVIPQNNDKPATQMFHVQITEVNG